MCRLSFFPKKFVENIPKDIVISFLKELELSNGGHGNGFYYLESGRLEKSVDIPLEKLYNNPHKEGFLFHTRRRSHGPIIDFLCHPFETKHYIILHNGIWNEYHYFKNLYGIKENVSDTYVMAKVIENYGFTKFLATFSRLGVLLVHDKSTKKTYCARTTGEFQILFTKFGCVFASNFEPFRYNGNNSSYDFLKSITKKRIRNISHGIYELNSNNFIKINLNKTKNQRKWIESERSYIQENKRKLEKASLNLTSNSFLRRKLEKIEYNLSIYKEYVHTKFYEINAQIRKIRDLIQSTNSLDNKIIQKREIIKLSELIFEEVKKFDKDKIQKRISDFFTPIKRCNSEFDINKYSNDDISDLHLICLLNHKNMQNNQKFNFNHNAVKLLEYKHGSEKYW
ncbi:MAG: hypothetical protein ACFFAH_02120 [Promethearchaeota archaeon]